ncbi:MAG: protein kinase, partial [Myxococcota bacterium]
MEHVKHRKRDDQCIQFGKYLVQGRLAVGGMAELFVAKQPGLGGFSRSVVLKCILPHLVNQDQFVQMFLDEARIAAYLDHPNIVHIWEVGELVGIYYIVMEYIRGQTLRSFRKRFFQRCEEQSPYCVAASIIAQAASGIHSAHQATREDGAPLNIIHRDLSPTNLLLSYDGVV